MTLPIKFLGCAALGFVTAGLTAHSAVACSYNKGLTARKIVAREIRGARKVSGRLHITKGTQKQYETSLSGRPLSLNGVDFEGILTNPAGRAVRIVYRDGGLDGFCNPLNKPHGDTSGTFYLKRTKTGSFELIHWVED